MVLRKSWLALFSILCVVQVYGGTLGLRLGYFAGVPVGVVSGAGTVTWLGDTFSVEVREGPVFKSGFSNLDVGVVYNIYGFVSIEGGAEFHCGYKNKRAIVVGRVLRDGIVEPLKETIEEDSIKVSLFTFYCGGRLALPFKGRFKTYAVFGPVLSLTRLEGLDLQGQIRKVYTKGENFGLFLGGGVEFFVSGNVALDFPVKYRLFFGSPQTLRVEWFDTVDEFDVEIRPVPVLSFGGDVGFYVF
ncbi:MAG: outer membrane beta-barrel protein [Candidatus Coatesbacteria bacterium]|nr:MAG: outer membrane beta-barrel protein [Candidatus Coatesbacteria bacterium]